MTSVLSFVRKLFGRNGREVQSTTRAVSHPRAWLPEEDAILLQWMARGPLTQGRARYVAAQLNRLEVNRARGVRRTAMAVHVRCSYLRHKGGPQNAHR